MSRFLWLILLFSFLFSGCAQEEYDETEGWSQQKLFTEANDLLNSGDYERAIKYYEILESRYPYGQYAYQSQLNVAYAYYKFQEPDSAIAAADRFIKFHQGHPATAYAWYLKGLANFNRGKGLMDKLLPSDDSQRDPGAELDAYNDFAFVVEKFPESKYSEDSRARMLHLRNSLAMHEVHVARYYMKRGAFVAAANRGKYVVQNYQKTPALKEALEIMISAYTKLGMDDLASDAQRVLEYNKGKGAFTQELPALAEEEDNWIQDIWDKLGLDED